MSSFVKKLMATGAALTIGISSFAVADYTYNMSNNNGYGNNSYGNNCCFSAPACDPCASWCDNVSFDAAWLYWKISSDDFQYAVEKVTTVSGTPALSTSKEKFHDISFDLKSGFRIGVGFDLPSYGWGIYVDWTHFHASTNKSLTVVGDASPPQSVTVGFPVLNGFGSGVLGSGESVSVDGHIKFDYDTVDIEFGKWLSCGCNSLMFRPHAGFRVADIKEKFTDSISGTAVTFGPGLASADFETDNHFKGFGVRVGLDTDFHFCDGWSIIGRGAASAIWGNTRLKNTLVLSTAAIASSETDYIRENYHQTRFITDLSLGVRWKTMACGCYPLTIQLAWEHHYLFNQHRYWVDDAFDSTATTSSWRSTGDVALQGLTLTAGFDF
jgi:hypothetical protein